MTRDHRAQALVNPWREVVLGLSILVGSVTLWTIYHQPPTVGREEFAAAAETTTTSAPGSVEIVLFVVGITAYLLLGIVVERTVFGGPGRTDPGVLVIWPVAIPLVVVLCKIVPGLPREDEQ